MGRNTDGSYWSDDHARGVPALDDDHRTICDLLAEIDGFLASGVVDEALVGKLKLLREHLAAHNRNEDRMMAGFTDVVAVAHRDRHRRVHDVGLDLIDQMHGHVGPPTDSESLRVAMKRFSSLFFEEMIRFDFDLIGLLRNGPDQFSPSV